MAQLTLNFLGDVEVVRGGERLSLPPSKKTRALLAYLALNDRPFGRERLCDLLWEIPDDPRGALRWSLSKLRRLVDEPGRPRIIADRQSVGFDRADVDVDVVTLKALAPRGTADDGVSVDALEAAVARFRGGFLEGLDLSRHHEFHNWCQSEREAVVRAQAAVLDGLVRRLEDHQPDRALGHARARVSLVPYDEAAWAALIRLLMTLSRNDEAERQYRTGLRLLQEAGLEPAGALHQARRRSAGRSVGARHALDPGSARSRLPARAPGDAVPAGALAPQQDGHADPVPPEQDGDADPLVGRDEEVKRLLDAVARVQRVGRAGVMLFVGEPGIGKSRMLRAATTLAGQAGAVVLEASAVESGAMRPFALWIDAFRRLEPGDGGLLDGVDYDHRDRLFGALSGWVAQAAADQPVVVAFDDLQWCDESSAAALHYVARMNRHRPLLAVLAGRDEELHGNGGLQRALRGLRHDGLLEEIRLRRLSDAAISQIILQHAPEADAGQLARQAGGNPLLAIELTRAVAGADPGTSLGDLVRERLALLESEVVEALRWASVVAPRLELPLLARVTGLAPAALGAAFEIAERHALLQTADGGFRFPHHLVTRRVYGDISPARRRLMHRRVAEVLQEEAALDLGLAADLAHHALQSEDPWLAAHALVAAARQCLRFFANEDAMTLARRGMDLVPRLGEAERVCVSLELHDVLMKAGAPDDWEAAAREYVMLAEQALDHGALAHARLGYQLASVVRWQHGQWAGAREETLQAERATRAGAEPEQAVAMAETARCLAMLERDIPQAEALLADAQVLAARHRISHQAIPLALGLLRFRENALAEAEERFKDARTLSKVAGDREAEYQANEYLLLIEWERGDYAAAEQRCRALLELGEKLRDGSEAPFSQALVGLCRYAREDDPQPLDAALHGLRVADARHRLATVLIRAALLDLERGRVDTAVARADEALACAETLGRDTECLLAHSLLSRCHRQRGDGPAAARHRAAAECLDPAAAAVWARARAEGLR